MIRAAALAAALVVLGGCDGGSPSYGELKPYDQPVGLKARDADRYDLLVLRDPERGVTCWRPSNDNRALSCLPDWMLQAQGPSEAIAHQPTWGDGRPCAGHKVCEGFSNRREALACAEGRLTGPACDAWAERQREDRGL
ncbi:hypothetical protein FHR70_000683 [Microvirga lupini]|uniref:Lipoprotein n=1 Tax=Microvirga lupini TaxID=420324 RepID=A0A7W4VI42_9HYPH|nr:hypothetical protein [Microvirga lupini]